MKSNAEIIQKIHDIAGEIRGNIHIMEVCGTHTQVISHFGIRQLLPKNVILSTGPGCPVCVTAQEDIDAIVNIAKAGIAVATYGDVLRVPGYYGSLDTARERGANVFDVYSTQDVLELQKEYPEIVFFGMGFETTTPMTAWAVKNGITVYSTHKLFLPAMHALIDRQEVRIDGFLSPGHVATITGSRQFESLKTSQVVTGFEAVDVLVGIYMLIRQIKEGRKDVENEYKRLVRNDGNKKARKIIEDVFEIGDGNWRGFGIIPGSGFEIKKKYEKLDAKKKYKNIISKMDLKNSRKPTGCKCGEVIRALITPEQCPMFGKVCTPEKPYGPCMVSSEGACNVSFRYKK